MERSVGEAKTSLGLHGETRAAEKSGSGERGPQGPHGHSSVGAREGKREESIAEPCLCEKSNNGGGSSVNVVEGLQVAHPIRRMGRGLPNEELLAVG